MRWMRFTVLLLVLIPCHSMAQRYSEGACLLLQHQIDRYENQRSNPNYRSARREYDKYCYVPAAQKPAVAQAVKTPPVQTSIARRSEPTTSVAASAVKDIAPVASVAPTAQTALVAEKALAAPETTTATDTAVVAEMAAAPDTAAVAETPVAADTASQTETALVENVPLQQASATLPLPIVAPEAAANNPALPTEHPADYDALLLQLLTALPLIAANIVALLLVVFLFTNWFGLNLPGFKGVFAEYKLNRLLRWRLSNEYRHFRKLKLLTDKDEVVLIDHLLLSPYGLFVIMVKSYRGRISGSESQANWSRDYLGKHTQFMNPLHQNFKNMQALKQLLELTDFEQLHAVVAFARVGQFSSAMPANITYVDTAARAIKKYTERCISAEQLARYGAVLQRASAE